MSKVTSDMSMSLDGFTAGTNQRLDAPFGDGVGDDGQRLHRWMFERAEENAEEIEALTAAGAYIMGRNMFSPGRGDWDLDWKGWWGDDPPYHAPVFVLTHHAREPLTMEGGTTFTFVTDGIESALAQARAAAGERDVQIGGGADVARQYLEAGLVDEFQLHVAQMLLGGGTRLLDNVGSHDLQPLSVRSTELVTHMRYRVVR